MPEKKSIMRSLGEFFGHVTKAVKTPVDGPRPHGVTSTGQTRSNPTQSGQAQANQVRRTVQERAAETPDGPVVLRRTVIDEVVKGPGSQ